MKLSIKLPDELGISDRSRKFWDDKYEFDDNGFMDKDGGKCLATISRCT